MLKRLGYEAELVSEPETVLARIGDPGRPGIEMVVSDLNMPGINGRQLLRSVLAAKPGTKVVLASGQEPDAEASGLEAPFLPKPYTLQSLAVVVAGCFANPGPRQ